MECKEQCIYDFHGTVSLAMAGGNSMRVHRIHAFP